MLVGGLLVWLFAIRDDSSSAPATTVTVTTTTASATPTGGTTTVAEQPAAAPDLVGVPYAEATRTAADSGVAADGYPVESAEPRGTVVAQNPEPGETLGPNERIRLNVAIGSGPRATVTVPDATGPEAPEARARLVDAKLTARTVDRDAPEPDNVDEVILQRPDAGATVPELTQVTIYVGR